LHKSISKKAMKSEKKMSKQSISEEFGTVPTPNLSAHQHSRVTAQLIANQNSGNHADL
jgi:hypothetical protein